MAVCQKSGRQVSDHIYIPLSEHNPGMTSLRCTCGSEIIYKQPGYDAREKKRSEEDYQRRMQKHKENTIEEDFGKSYTLFLSFCCLSIICSSAYLLIVNIINDHVGAGILLFLGSFFLLVLLLGFMTVSTSYPKCATESLIRRRRSRTLKLRLIGVALGLAVMVFYIRAGLNGGFFLFE